MGRTKVKPLTPAEVAVHYDGSGRAAFLNGKDELVLCTLGYSNKRGQGRRAYVTDVEVVPAGPLQRPAFDAWSRTKSPGAGLRAARAVARKAAA